MHFRCECPNVPRHDVSYEKPNKPTGVTKSVAPVMREIYDQPIQQKSGQHRNPHSSNQHVASLGDSMPNSGGREQCIARTRTSKRPSIPSHEKKLRLLYCPGLRSPDTSAQRKREKKPKKANASGCKSNLRNLSLVHSSGC